MDPILTENQVSGCTPAALRYYEARYFFERFRELNVRSNEQLDDLVGQCQQVVQGVEPQSLRDNNVLRQSVASELNQVQSVLDDLLVDRPRRNILRRPR